MKRSIIYSLLLALSFFSVSSLMADEKKSADPVKEAIQKSLQKVRPDFVVDRIEKSGVADLYEVYFARGGMAYVTADGSHLIDGKLYKVAEGRMFDVQEEKFKPMRAKVLSATPNTKKIVFSPEGEVKASIDVFTDVDCGYCQKLHSHIAEYNNLGIEVRYLAFPRAGPNSVSAKSLVSAWCADDPKDALTKLKMRQKIPAKTCDNPVADQYALGEKIGVTGTPAVFTKDGSLVGGYLDPNQMAQVLGVK